MATGTGGGETVVPGKEASSEFRGTMSPAPPGSSHMSPGSHSFSIYAFNSRSPVRLGMRLTLSFIQSQDENVSLLFSCLSPAALQEIGVSLQGRCRSFQVIYGAHEPQESDFA